MLLHTVGKADGGNKEWTATGHLASSSADQCPRTTNLCQTDLEISYTLMTGRWPFKIQVSKISGKNSLCPSKNERILRSQHFEAEI